MQQKVNNTFDITIKTFKGLEGILEEEVKQLGGENVKQGVRVVQTRGDMELVYKINLWSRTALRVLIPISTFKAKTTDEIYQVAKKIDWSQYMTENDTFAVDSTVHSKLFTHSKYVALVVKDAIVDQFRYKTDKRPNVDLEWPTLRINIHVSEDSISISLDSSGDSLHRRGYRSGKHEAPINEVLAAGLILLSGWDAKCDLLDPFCGSATILIEATRIARQIPPNIQKRFGFQQWENYDKTLWEKVVEEAKKEEKDCQVKIVGSDISNLYTEVARINIEAAGLEGKITIEQKAFRRTKPLSPEPGIIITNPPYGERLMIDEVDELYKNIGSTLKRKYIGHKAWIISSNMDAFNEIGFKAEKKIEVYNGPLLCHFNCYDIYEGSKKTQASID